MANRASFGVGHISRPEGSTAFEASATKFETFRAGGAITQGAVVMLAFDNTRPEVVEASAGEAVIYRIVGVYDPEFNSYKDAAEGDIVTITTYGIANALVNGGTTDVTVNIALETLSDGVLAATTLTLSNDTPAWQFIAAEAYADVGPALKKVFVKIGS